MKKIIFTILFSLFFLLNSEAGTPIGGQVTYRYLGSSKFEVTYRIYRDCRAIPINIATYTIRCASTSATKNLSATRVSITDITPSCAAVKKPCDPTGTGSLGIEENTYMDTLDFNGSESAFKSCCIIQIGVGQCCRSNAITTGAAGNDFWVFSTLDLCKAPTNSSPVFSFKPMFTEIYNERLMNSFFARDSIDKDSLSYSFTDPLTSFTGKTSWSSGLDFKNPFTAYYPAGYNKALGPKPESYPPIGIYLDPLTGNLIGMPVSSSEMSIMAIAVKEWRKDSNGKYVQIGETVIDRTISILQVNNHTPAISAKLVYNLCEGQPFSLDIPTDDQPFTQPPPATSILNDTVTLSWDKNIKNATYTIPNPNVKLPAGKFEWTPATGDSKKSPFSFSVMAQDNGCPIRSVVVKTIRLKVFPKISVSSAIKKINASTYAVGINISNKNYAYVAGKNISSTIQADPRNYYFKSSSLPYSTSENDTLIFKRNGTYIISQNFLSETECNSTSLKDTIVISNLLEVTLGINSLGIYTDTSFCRYQPSQLYAKTSNATRPVTYTWKSKNKTHSDTTGYFTNSYATDDTVFLSIKDAAGKTNSTFRVVKVLDIPVITAGPDKTVCPGVFIYIKAKQSGTGAISWEWFKGSTKISSIDSVALSSAGIYTVTGTNSNGCQVSDTVKIGNFNTIKIDLVSGEYCQEKKELAQTEIFSINPNFQFSYISWSLVKTLQNTTGGSNFLGDILFDSDPGPKFDYKIRFDDSRVLIPFNLKDSLILRANAIDTNGCKSSDNMTVTIIKKPEITFGSGSVDACLNKTIDLALSGSSTGTHQWVPFYRSGFGNWPSYQPITGDTIPGGFIKKPGIYKIRMEATVQFCKNNDSLLLNLLPLPKAIVSVKIVNEAVRYKDHTPDILSRKWFINNSLFSVADTLLASKSFINTQPVKLQLTDKNGCTGDTIMYLSTGRIGIINNSKIELYPNPSGTFIILKQMESWVPTQFEIFDVLGKNVISGITRSKEEIINIQSIKPGVYYLKYNLGTNALSIPFIRTE